MSDKKKRLAKQQPAQEEIPLVQDDQIGSSAAQRAAPPSEDGGQPSPTELLGDLLAGLENSVQVSAAGVSGAENAPIQGEGEAAQKAMQPAPEPEQAEAADHAEPQEPEQPVFDPVTEPDAAEEEEDLPPETEPDEDLDLPAEQENALTLHAGSEMDETTGMTLLQRVQYHARMRRREQTRLRRESARRGAVSGEIPYQAMSPMDMRFTLIRLAVAALFLILGAFLSQVGFGFAFYLIAYLITVLPIIIKVAHQFTHGKYFDEYLLILISSFGAFLLGNQAEASIILILHGVGKIVSDLVLASTHKSLTQQTEFVPSIATVVNMQGEERQAAPDDVKVGDFLLVRSGERIPIDGVVLRGEGTVDVAVLTGDSEPVPVEKNKTVLAGSVYTGSLLLMRASARFEDCAVNQISRVEEEGTERKSALENSVMYGATRVIPVIIVLAVLLSVIPPLFNSGTSMSNWVYRALTILMVCCPTALVICVPLCFSCGGGRLMQKGVHVKGSEAIEKMAELRMVVFDKTGILTSGDLRVKEIHGTQDFNQESCLALAAAAEQLSRHPVARAVVAAYQGTPQKISEFEEFPGRGVRARIGNRNLLAGNRRLMVSRGVKGVPDIRGTVVYIAYEGEYAGAIVLEDSIRSEAQNAVNELKSQGVLRTVILTGDTELPTHQAAEAIGIDTVHFGLQPEEKASKMEFLMRTIPTDGTAAYVGDGINDIEELKMADVGVTMGAAGSQQSAAATNVLLMNHDLMRLSDTLRICRRTHSIALQNMVVVILMKILLALLTLLGVAYMWQAVAADVLLTVLTVLNAARILGSK